MTLRGKRTGFVKWKHSNFYESLLSVLYEVLKDRTAVSETKISVDEVNDLLDRLSQANTV